MININLTHYWKLMKKLCVGCGACIGICPKEAISPTEIKGYASINIDTSKCIQCGLCVKFCPIISYLNTSELPKKLNSNIKIFTGHATKTETRYHGASGGTVTALLTYLLEESEVDGVLVVKTHGKKAIPQLVTNVKDLKDTQGSIYFPTFSLKLIRRLRGIEGSYAVVGLPCQIDVLKKLIEVKFLPKNRIKYFLGLRCYHVNAPWYLTYMINKMLKLPVNDVYQVTARRYGWPGKVLIKTRKENYIVPHFYNKRTGTGLWNPLALLHLTAQLGCLLCTNHENINADITFGDAWIPKIVKKDKIGSSLIITRTKRGTELIRKAESTGRIAVNILNREKRYYQSNGELKSFNKTLRMLIKEGAAKTIRQQNIANIFALIPHLAFTSTTLRQTLLKIIPPKILMTAASTYIKLISITSHS